MPNYSFVCLHCGEPKNLNCYMRDYENEKEKIKDCGSCGGPLVRSFVNVNLQGSDGKSNPNSINNWQNGKTDDEITDVMFGDSEPY